ncbi:GTP-binding protein 2 [Smittium culicis]|uniref:GTP-binding protein 2 n=1 Tax=Smittium culicis TaxID=133412 RepID=A0A1R1YCK3_9FUNG|nr:GTP-binding protein 2 [Smittium culicis]
MTSKELFFSEEKKIDSKSRGTITNESLISLPPELDTCGNVEYKYKLINVTKRKISHLSTQLLWRLSQGNGEAIYQLGVLDDGTIKGIPESEMVETISALEKAAKLLKSAYISSSKWRRLYPKYKNSSLAHSKDLKPLSFISEPSNSCLSEFNKATNNSDNVPLFACEVTIKTRKNKNNSTDIRFVLLGEHKVGKSTLLGCLAHKVKDNGRGRARLGILRHRHELISGTSSSISQEVIKIAENPKLNDIDTSDFDFLPSPKEELDIEKSISSDPGNKVLKHVAFVDTCGHIKHLKTTIRGTLGKSPDYIMIVLSADTLNLGISVYRNILLSLILRAPIMFVITKMDLVNKDLISSFIHSLASLSQAAIPNSGQTVINTTLNKFDSNQIHEMSYAYSQSKLVPIFLCSCMQQSMVILNKFISNLSPRNLIYNNLQNSTPLGPNEKKEYDIGKFEVEKIFKSIEGSIVLLGLVRSGSLSINYDSSFISNQKALNNSTLAYTDYESAQSKNQQLICLLGPDKFGLFKKVNLLSILHHGEPTNIANKGDLVSIEISIDETDYFQKFALVRPGSILFQCQHSLVDSTNSFIKQPKLSSLNPNGVNLSGEKYPKTVHSPFFAEKFELFSIKNRSHFNEAHNSFEGSDLYRLTKFSNLPDGNVRIEFLVNVVLVEFKNMIDMSCVGTVYTGSIRQQAKISSIFYNGKKFKFQSSLEKKKRKHSSPNKIDAENSESNSSFINNPNNLDKNDSNSENSRYYDGIWNKLIRFDTESSQKILAANVPSADLIPSYNSLFGPESNFGEDASRQNGTLGTKLFDFKIKDLESALPINISNNSDPNPNAIYTNFEAKSRTKHYPIGSISNIDSPYEDILRSGDIVTAKIQLLVRKEYIQLGYPIVFMQGTSIIFAGYVSKI